METFSYKCPVCGFVYAVPAYWMAFTPEETTMFPHMKPAEDTPCENAVLELIEEQ